MHERIAKHNEEIAAACRRNHVRRLAIFGSALRGDFNPERSDVDLIVEFEPLSIVQYSESYFALLEDLSRIFARKVDLVVLRNIKNPYFLKEVESTQETLYAA